MRGMSGTLFKKFYTCFMAMMQSVLMQVELHDVMDSASSELVPTCSY